MRKTVISQIPDFNNDPQECMKELKKAIRKMERAVNRKDFSNAYFEAEEALNGAYAMAYKLPGICGLCRGSGRVEK